MKTITKDIANNKKVIIRLDLDVPLDENKQVKDITRLQAILPTLHLLNESANQIIIIGHLGRPEGKVNPEFTLKPVSQKLSELLQHEIAFIENSIPLPQNLSLPNSKFVMLENLRFESGEEKNDSQFAKQLASLGDIFIFEAFAVSHRAAASTVGITEHLPSYAGLRVTKEVEQLSEIVDNPTHPLLIIIGGAKIETKLPVINNFMGKADAIFVAGKLPHEIKEKNLQFPSNVHVASLNESGKDIDESSEETIKKLIEESQMIVWNGPVGLFEEPENQDGTKTVAQELAMTTGKKIIGGGETIEAATHFGIIDQLNFVSVGGGAMLEFLSGKQLPGLQNI